MRSGSRAGVAPDQLLENVGSKVVGSDPGQRATMLPEGGTHGVVDERLSHRSVSSTKDASASWAIMNAWFAAGTPQ